MRAIRAGLALLLVAGCHTWQERPVTAPDPSTDTGTLRLTTNQGPTPHARACDRSIGQRGRTPRRCRQPARRLLGARQQHREGEARRGRDG